MPGSWTSFSIPNTSTGQFNADIMLLLTDGSVLVHNGYVTTVDIAKQWLRLSPDSAGHYDTGEWSGELNMKFGDSGLHQVYSMTVAFLLSVAKTAATRSILRMHRQGSCSTP
jgi:hypothetical protein